MQKQTKVGNILQSLTPCIRANIFFTVLSEHKCD